MILDLYPPRTLPQSKLVSPAEGVRKTPVNLSVCQKYTIYYIDREIVTLAASIQPQLHLAIAIAIDE